jgi:hypothetical protein
VSHPGNAGEWNVAGVISLESAQGFGSPVSQVGFGGATEMQIEALKRVQLPVLSHRGRWLICFRGKRAEFVDRESALREAIEQAFQCSKNGSPTEVICVDDNLTTEVVWTYGVDPNPPTAEREPAKLHLGPRAPRQALRPPASRTMQPGRLHVVARKSKENRRAG